MMSPHSLSGNLTLCNLGASTSSDVVEFGAGCVGSATFRGSRELRSRRSGDENICGLQEYAGVSREVRRAADEVAVFAVPADSAQHASLPDYLSYTPSVRGLYPRSPIFSEWVKDESQRVVYDAARRGKVSEILERQNRAWGASPKTLANIERLRRGALAAVTGQQVGLFGGPLFSIFKALTAVKLAEQATAAGVDCVPVFWLATEDHDLAEVNHVALLSEQGLPEPLAAEPATP